MDPKTKGVGFNKSCGFEKLWFQKNVGFKKLWFRRVLVSKSFVDIDSGWFTIPWSTHGTSNSPHQRTGDVGVCCACDARDAEACHAAAGGSSPLSRKSVTVVVGDGVAGTVVPDIAVLGAAVLGDVSSSCLPLRGGSQHRDPHTNIEIKKVCKICNGIVLGLAYFLNTIPMVSLLGYKVHGSHGGVDILEEVIVFPAWRCRFLLIFLMNLRVGSQRQTLPKNEMSKYQNI